MKPGAIHFGLAALALAVGLGLKSYRYADRFAPGDGKDIARITDVLTAAGWTAVPRDGIALPFALASFSKPGCSAELTVAPLGFSREFVDEMRLALGPDVGFVESGSGLGLLAVSPAQQAPAGACSAPATGAWG